MDSLLSAAARALSAGDPLGALKRVALREDAPAVALRGIAFAQLGDLTKAHELLKAAQQRFPPRETQARARCQVALSEVALADRELDEKEAKLQQAIEQLEACGDMRNAAHGRLTQVRQSLLLGQLDKATELLNQLEATASPTIRAIAALMEAGIHSRRLSSNHASKCLDLAEEASTAARIPALAREIATARATLASPIARTRTDGVERLVSLAEVEHLFASETLIVDACRRTLRAGSQQLDLSTRPALFAVLRALAEASPSDVPRTALISATMGVKRPNDSHRARLRVEVTRLRKAVHGLATIEATPDGYVLRPSQVGITLLIPPIDGEDAAVQALLADGLAWSSRSLSLALGWSQRSAQRALLRLEEQGAVNAIGRARNKRWLAAPLDGFAMTLLLAGR